MRDSATSNHGAFQIALADRSVDDVFAGFNRCGGVFAKPEKLSVTVERADRDGLAEFHLIYVETAARDGFVPCGLPHFQMHVGRHECRTGSNPVVPLRATMVPSRRNDDGDGGRSRLVLPWCLATSGREVRP